MASSIRLPTCGPPIPREHDIKAGSLTCPSGMSALSSQHHQVSDVPAPITSTPNDIEGTCNHDGDSRGDGSDTDTDTEKDCPRRRGRTDEVHVGQVRGTLVRGYKQALACVSTIIACTRIRRHAIFRSWIWLLAVSAIVVYTDASALPPSYWAQSGQGIANEPSTVVDDNVKLLEGKPDLERPAVREMGPTILVMLFITILGGIAALESFHGDRKHRVRVMGYICVSTLVAAAASMVLHQAGGAEAEVDGPLWMFWTVAYLNFVLRGALLVQHDRAGYLSPLGYVGTVVVFLSFVFLAAGTQSSRFYATLITLSITVIYDVGLRALFDGLHDQAAQVV